VRAAAGRSFAHGGNHGPLTPPRVAGALPGRRGAARYLQTAFEDAIKKLLRVLSRYSQADCNKLAILVSYVTASQLAPMSVLSTLFMDHLVKEGPCAAALANRRGCETLA